MAFGTLTIFGNPLKFTTEGRPNFGWFHCRELVFGKEAGLDFGGEEELNILFNYNGHLWDAFEVLGVPAGSGLEMIERAYEQSVNSMDPSSRELIDLAYQAIQQRLNP